MDFLRGVRSKTFSSDKQIEKEPTLLYGALLTPSSVGTIGIARCYNGEGTDAELIVEFMTSYDNGAKLLQPIQFSRGLYLDIVSGLATVSLQWLTNEQALSMFLKELELRRQHDLHPDISIKELGELLGQH